MEEYQDILFTSDYKKSSGANKWTCTLILLSLALITRIILFFAAKNPSQVESLYSASIYPYIAGLVGSISGIIPFSIAETFLILTPLLIIIGLIAIIKKPSLFLNNINSILHYIVRFLAVIYILFYFLWGFNYYRPDYSVIANMDEASVTYTDLKKLTIFMIEKTNEKRDALPEDENGLFFINESFKSLGAISNKGFDDYKVGTFSLDRNFSRIKPVSLSKFMSYTGVMGIYIPFTSEPTINVDIPPQNLLSTISHEIAHQKGFAKEEEANFIAYKANINNPDERFQYSGYYLALTYLINEVYEESRQDYFLLYTELSDAVKRDMAFASDYWTSKEGRIEDAVTTMNDNYLKANNQADGVKSYGGVVKLLLTEYKDQL
ncbi:MAG: DUF3810 domain-containing protein [Tissierellia bacterium]|nr:DUF3810 domain-containing protein [Tissierellia bacterium]MDD4727074.1 DUF3810 domain-containing protein [Tissierellia bacterium]